MNGMSAYSFWYLIIQKEWYYHHGDMAFLQKHREYIVGLIDFIVAHIDEDGGETFGRKFLDWPSTPNREGVEAGYRALLVWALKDAGELCTILNRPEAVQKCMWGIEHINRQIKPDNGLKQAAALMAIAGTADAGFLPADGGGTSDAVRRFFGSIAWRNPASQRHGRAYIDCFRNSSKTAGQAELRLTSRRSSARANG
jgi:hypothetical protein